VVAKEAHVVEDEAYPGEQVDRSLFATYEVHVARQLWNDVISNGAKIHALKLMCYLSMSNFEMIFIDYHRIMVS